MASPKQFKTAIVITGNADGAIKVTKATERQLGKLENRGKSVSAQLSNIAGTGIKYGAALGGAAAAGAAVMIKRQLEMIDSTAKVSDKLGIATEKLTALRLQAELTGAGQKTLDMGLQRMTRRVAEAARGTGEAQEAIKQLGLDAKELAQLSPDQQFAAIADAMEGVSSQGERVRLSFKLFDSEGVALVNTLRGGSAAALEAQQFTEQWGLALTRVDASKIEQANDAMTLLSRASEGFWKQLTVRVSPAITKAAEEALGLAEGYGTAAELADAAVDAIVDGLDSLANAAVVVGAVMAARLYGPAIQGYGAMTAAQVANTAARLKSNFVVYEGARAEAINAAALKKSALAEATKARATVAAAAAEVESQRAVLGSIKSEMQLEMVRHKAQISQAGRTASQQRMIAIRGELAVATAALTKAEAAHVATLNAQAAATARATAATASYTSAATAATLSARALAAAGSIASGAMAMLGGPVGVAVVAAAGLYTFREELGLVDTTARTVANAVSDLSDEIRDLDRVTTEANIRALEAAKADLERRAKDIRSANLRGTGALKNHGGILGFSRDQLHGESEALGEVESALALLTAQIDTFNSRLGDIDAGDAADRERLLEQEAEKNKEISARIALLKEENALLKLGYTLEEAKFIAAYASANAVTQALMRQQREQKGIVDGYKEAETAAKKLSEAAEKSAQELANQVDAFLSDGFDSKAFEAFDQLGKSMYGVVDALNEMVDRQAAFNELKAAEGITAEQVAKINAQHAQNQIAAYGDIAGAAKGFFSEGSKGYEALQAAEKTFRLFEIAMAGKALAAKLFTSDAAAAAEVDGVAAATAAEASKVAAVVQAEASKTAAVITAESTKTTAVVAGESVRAAAIASASAASAGAVAAAEAGKTAAIAVTTAAEAARIAAIAASTGASVASVAPVVAAEGAKATAAGTAAAASSMVGTPFPANLGALAATIAALAAIGVVMQGGGSGGSAPKGALDNKAYSGLVTSGTVLGDPDEASESLLNALGRIEGVEDLQLNYAKSMAASLNNIEKAMGGVAAGFASAAALRGAQSLKFSGTVGNVESEFGTRLNFRPFSTVTAETTQKELEEMFRPFILDDYAGRMRKAQDLIADLKEAGIDPATQSALQRVQNDMNKTFGAMGESLATAVSALGGDAQAAVDKFVSTTIDIDLREQEDIDEAVNQLFSSIADSAVAAANMQLSGVDLTQFQQVGEGLFETLTRVSGQVVSFKEAADALGISLSTEASVLSQGISKAIDRVLGRNTEGRSYTRDFSGAQLAEISDQLVGAAGGLSEFTGNVSDLIDVLLDDDQKFERNRSQLTTLFAGLNASLPTSAEALSQYIAGLDLSKEAHQKAFTAVSASSGAIGDFFDQLEDYADAAYNFDTALGIADGSKPLRDALAQVGLNLDIVETAAAGGSVALQALFVDLTDTQKAGLEPFADAITALLPESQLASAGLDGVAASLGRLGSASQGISNYLESLGYSEAAGTPEQRLTAARSQFASQVELALRGDEAAAGKLTGLADTVLSLGGEVYASGAQFQDLSSGVTSALAGVASAIDIQTPIEQQLGLLAEIRDAVAASPQGTAQFIEQRLAGYFEAIDANTDAMLTIGELSTALGDIASDDLLAEVVSTLDTNRDGTISRLEALIGATVGVESAVREIEPGSAESVIGALPVIPSIEELRAMRDRSASQRVRDSFRRIGDRLGFASGGYVSGPGTSTSDSIPAQLSNGEFVMQASAVSQYGPAFFDSLNTGRQALFDDRRMVEAIATLNREVEHQTRLNAEAARQTVAELKRLNRRVADIEAELETARVVS